MKKYLIPFALILTQSCTRQDQKNQKENFSLTDYQKMQEVNLQNHLVLYTELERELSPELTVKAAPDSLKMNTEALFRKEKPQLPAEAFAQVLFDVIEENVDFVEAEIELTTSYSVSADVDASIVVTYSGSVEYDHTMTTNFHFVSDTAKKSLVAPLQPTDDLMQLKKLKKQAREDINLESLQEAVKKANMARNKINLMGNSKCVLDSYSIKLDFILTYENSVGFTFKFFSDKLGVDANGTHSHAKEHSILIKFKNSMPVSKKNDA